MANIRFEGLTVKYGDKTILKNFNLEIKDGEIMGLVGPSGCGKTTVLRALCGFIKPEEGNIYVNDELVYSKKQRINIAPENRKIGVVFQDYAVWPHMSVYKNVNYPLKKRKVEKEEAAKNVDFALGQVRMKGYENHMPAQLSGGQQQRVAIARALVSSRDLIVLDEPITNLDAKLREEMIVEIRQIQQRLGTTIIYITHDQEAVLELCDRITIMNPEGEICQIGRDEEIIHNPASRYIFSFIGVSNFIPLRKNNDYYYFDIGTQAVQYNKDIPEHLAGFKEVEMGIRPMNIVFVENSPYRATIKRVIFLGNQYNYFLNFGNIELRVERNVLDVLQDSRKLDENDEVFIDFLDPKFYEKEVK